MSTRAAVVISNCKHGTGGDQDKIKDEIILFHHCDGYPGGVGSELVDYLHKFETKCMQRSSFWLPGEIANFITELDMSYRVIDSIPNTVEYIYVIDTSGKRLSCYSHDGYSAVDIDMLGDRLEIPDNEYDGRKDNAEPALDYTQLFKTCTCLKGIDGDDLVFTDGTRVPVSHFGVPMHDSPFPAPKPDGYKPSYVQVDEKLELYKKIFLIVLPTILRRESYPFDYKRIIVQANDMTVSTIRQFTKMREYYSEHI